MKGVVVGFHFVFWLEGGMQKKKIPLEEREGYTMIRLGDNRNSRIAWIKKTFHN